MSVSLSPQEWAGVAMILSAGGWYAWQWWQNRVPKVDKPDSDQEPPEGFTEFVDKILSAAEAAPPEIQVEYLRQGFTYADTLLYEVNRLTATKTKGGK